MSGDVDFPANSRALHTRESPLSPHEAEYFEKLVSLFCANRRGTHGYAESTITNYAGCLTRAIRAIGRPPWAWQAQDIDLLLSEQAERGVTAGTQVLTITALRGFQNFVLEDIGLCNEIQREFRIPAAGVHHLGKLDSVPSQGSQAFQAHHAAHA